MSNEVSEENYKYADYRKDRKEYEKTYLDEIGTRNKFVLSACGGAVYILLDILKEYQDDFFISTFFLVDILLYIFLGFFTLYSLQLRSEVSAKFMKMYDVLYDEFAYSKTNSFGKDRNERQEELKKNNKCWTAICKLESKFKCILVIKVFITAILIGFIISHNKEKTLKLIGDEEISETKNKNNISNESYLEPKQKKNKINAIIKIQNSDGEIVQIENLENETEVQIKTTSVNYDLTNMTE